MSKRSVSERYKRKEEKAKDPEADTTSRLTAGSTQPPVYTEIEAKEVC